MQHKQLTYLRKRQDVKTDTSQSKDIGQYAQLQQSHNHQLQRPTPEQARLLYPKQYKYKPASFFLNLQPQPLGHKI
jgi:hypothetical protein